MRNKVIWSFLSVVALSAGAFVSGCDSDATIAKSDLGESCDSSADCAEGLSCIQGACYTEPPSGGEGGSDDPGVTPPKPVLGGEGESCTRAADCEDGLGCFNQRCSMDVTGEGGGGNDPIRLGQVNEACRVTSDCAAGLACRLSPLSTAVSVCTPAGGQIDATGKTCNGAECVEAADCCQLPVETHAALGAKSCSELTSLLSGVDCDGAVVDATANARCFAQKTYCECDDTWSCSDSGRCVYEAECEPTPALGTPVADTLGHCPTYSRAGYVLGTFCNSDERCAPEAAADTGCTNDASCEGLAVADDAGGDKCVEDECTCIQKGCYRKCDGDLDCSGDYTDGVKTLIRRVCSTDLSVCVPEGSCVSNESCVRRLGDVNAVCLEGTCRTSCATDFDCNAGAISGGSYDQICNSSNICEPLGCEEDAECATTVNGVKLFCTAPSIPEPGTDVASAITD